jgi:deoxyribose-phosphate aldolase
MEINKILEKCDHTLLSQTAKKEEIFALIDDAIKYKTASVCIPPCFVKDAKEYANGKIKICTVIGFPNGYNETSVKVFETKTAVDNGADEIDMVINIGKLKDKDYDYILTEIKEIKKACSNKLLKVIIETCLLTDEEKVKMCEIVSKSGAEYIKTSTGFSKNGATIQDVKLMVNSVNNGVLVKAAGGISSIKDAEDFINIGASRLGTSRVVKAVKELEK